MHFDHLYLLVSELWDTKVSGECVIDDRDRSAGDGCSVDEMPDSLRVLHDYFLFLCDYKF
jgi:hypothetical protein